MWRIPGRELAFSKANDHCEILCVLIGVEAVVVILKIFDFYTANRTAVIAYHEMVYRAFLSHLTCYYGKPRVNRSAVRELTSWEN